MQVDEMAKGVLAGDKRSIAKAISVVENSPEEAQKLIATIYPHTGKAHIIGVTGPGGAGKSTLIEKMVREYRRRGKTVGVIAVDPTSPFTGGAFLGDRIRMQELSTNEGVFIRSMATRNNPGGIAKATKDAVKILDAAGKDFIIVETAGAGQSEVDIVKVAQTVVLVHAPGLGDEIQAIKAGLMEIADIFVVNKADRENANKTVMDIQAVLQLDDRAKAWNPPVIKTVAITGEGVPQLLDKIEEHRRFLQKELWQKRSWERAQTELIEAIRDKVTSSIIEKLKREKRFEKILKQIVNREMDPATAAEKLLNQELE
ncbi:MAG: methylmalonyl Co-A mutase-associated GTPase MeaB [Candidatus Bathyarchaeia archaeon]